MQPDFERRFFLVEGLRIEKREGKGGMLIGHAAVFNQRSENLGGFVEVVAPGAFTEAIEKDDIRALWNHDSNLPLGRKQAGTLRLSEDARGLAVEIDLPDTPMHRDMVLSPIERGDVNQMSFGFQVRPGGADWAIDDDGTMVRTVKRVRLFEVSPVTFPAYPQTDVAKRSLDAWREEHAKPKTPNLLQALAEQARAL